MEKEPEELDVALFNRVGDLMAKAGNVAEATNYYEKAVDHYTEGGFFNNAIALCSKILRASPGRATVYYKLGKISAKKGFKADAKKNFLEYADRMQPVQPTPADRVKPALDERCAYETADEGVSRARGKAEPPGGQVPGHGGHQAGADHANRGRGLERDDSPDRVGDRRSDQDRAEHVEDRRKEHRLEGAGSPGRYQGGDRVRGVVEAVRDGEGEREHDRNRKARVHRRTLRRFAGGFGALEPATGGRGRRRRPLRVRPDPTP